MGYKEGGKDMNEINCPLCGSKNVVTEKRLDGNHICQDCHHTWKNIYILNEDERDPARISIFLNHVEKLWKKFPDLRFTQVVSMIETQAKEMFKKVDIFYLEEQSLLEVISFLVHKAESNKQ